MRITKVPTGARRYLVARVLACALLVPAAALCAAAPAVAAPSSSASPDGDDSGPPTEAGTNFRTATPVQQDEEATADGSTGDYLYWVFPADTGQAATVRAEVTFPEGAVRKSATTWGVEVYDGLRRRQACVYGSASRTVPAEAGSVRLTCHLRTVRAWAEPWSNDPLPGSYYIRLTALEASGGDMGLPMHAEVKATSVDKGGAAAVGGRLGAPVVAGIGPSGQAMGAAGAARAPEDGWSSGRWTDRWIWTIAGGVLGALAGIGGYALTRGSGRPSRVPPGV
ncbi:hypothetical protein [Streptomyces tsukubensis]|uniref:Secreted protein n=1 Tax=Streptomyces tsukubensis TaxID=83656 RepID=A0A1V4AES5_9ACTN|nr:hypothetical protein [Streptomyces tsukubensis]OON82616.1 hypothetical protein B1H18_00665 [Streptomyces tsukubensis]QFR92212.1 hypothetical protein GBW32_03025 [Streptomyces tsukubensis]